MAKRNRYYEDEKINHKFSGKSALKALRFCVPYRKILITMVVLVLIFSFVALLPPMINRYIVDDVLSGDGKFGLGVVETAIVLVAGYALASFSAALFTYFQTLYMTKTGQSVIYDMRHATFEKLQKLAFDYYDSRPNGKILVRVTAYLDELASVFSNSIVSLIVDIFKVGVIFIWMIIIDWRLALIVILMLIPMALCLMAVRKSIARRRRIHRNSRSNRTAFLAENIQGATVIKTFNRVEKNTQIQAALNEDASNKWRSVIRVNEFMLPTMDGFMQLGTLVVYIVAVIVSMNSDFFGAALTIGQLIAFISYMGQLPQPLNDIATVVQQITMAASNLESVFEVIEEEPTIVDDENAEELLPIEGNIKFEDVTFSYDKGRTVLENLSFEVEKGKMVALVGPTGAGKTTIVSLISRFYDIDSGKISIDGQDISKVTLYSLRRQVGVMMQDSFIFSGTIIDNIRYARPDATDEECIEAAKAVSADEFIERLPDGYYTKTSEQGSGLSTGERQLISFARVVLTDPKILILDEATASIDTHTEELIRAALDRILEGRTSFVIAHRLSTVRKADCILYIADKGIAEAGTHEQLMEKQGLYYKLVKANGEDDGQ